MNKDNTILGLKELLKLNTLPYSIEEPNMIEGASMITKDVILSAIELLEEK